MQGIVEYKKRVTEFEDVCPNRFNLNIMKKLLICALLLATSFISFGQQPYTIIPYPNQLDKLSGAFELKQNLSVTLPRSFASELKWLTATFKDEYGIAIAKSAKGQVVFKQDKTIANEAYRLTVASDKIAIEAATPTGCFYAVQSLRHLMQLTGTGNYRIAACKIEDKPAFGWRAFMLDESRNFKGKAVVKQMLDQMALLKMNVFHWHLTDDQGWRIEIKKYPLLTEVGAWRDSTQSGIWPTGWKSTTFDPNAHGGYYTQDDIREIVAYAAARHITIVPEIEMPGHASAAVAAYPWLGTTGEAIKVPSSYGFLKPVVYNIADERVYTFIEDVLKEVMALFPSKVIHIGGDEVNYDPWKQCTAITQLMEREGFKNYSDVQIYFTNRVSNFIDSQKRSMMGWNEILGKNVHEWSSESDATGSLAKSSIIHFWKGKSEMLKDAITRGYSVVNSDNPYTYLDYDHKAIPLSKAYSFSPVPQGISESEAKQVLGLGCQMWCEFIPKVTDLYSHVFPRIAAYAEVGWTQTANKDYDRFTKSLTTLKRYWDSKGITYYTE